MISNERFPRPEILAGSADSLRKLKEVLFALYLEKIWDYFSLTEHERNSLARRLFSTLPIEAGVLKLESDDFQIKFRVYAKSMITDKNQFISNTHFEITFFCKNNPSQSKTIILTFEVDVLRFVHLLFRPSNTDSPISTKVLAIDSAGRAMTELTSDEFIRIEDQITYLILLLIDVFKSDLIQAQIAEGDPMNFLRHFVAPIPPTAIHELRQRFL